MRRLNYDFHYTISQKGIKYCSGFLDGLLFSFEVGLDRSCVIGRIMQSTSCTHQDACDCYESYIFSQDHIPVTGFANYQNYLNDPSWKRQRKKALKRAWYRCEYCGSTKNLDVHHMTYRRVGHEDDDDLIVLCHTCHQKVHGITE